MLQMIRKNVADFRDGEAGATATEYVLLLAGIAAIIIVAVFAFGGFLSGKFNSTANTISTKTAP
jgi:pilus assembly protein Flp/PilA